MLMEAQPRKLTVVLVVSFSVLLLLCACATFTGALLLPVLNDAADRSSQNRLVLQMTRVGLAIDAYHDVYRDFPPLHSIDDKGRPACSWRVLIAPFLHEADLARLPDWSQQWDDPVNRSTKITVPEEFVSPLVPDPLTTTETHVFALVRPEGPLRQTGNTGAGNHTGDDSRKELHSVVAVYLPNHTVHWAAPVDITLKRLQDEVFNATIESPVALLFVDGSVSLIESSMEPRLLQELIFNPTM